MPLAGSERTEGQEGDDARDHPPDHLGSGDEHYPRYRYSHGRRPLAQS
ncbi:hypothetical protein ACVIVC_001233 [Sinorhizobium meliloti]